MRKETYLTVAEVAAGVGVMSTLAWAATGVSWGPWAVAAAIGVAVGFLVGGYIKEED